jgi:hypothetical protein
MVPSCVDHEVFQLRGRKPQRPVSVHLLVALARFGIDGKGASATRLGVGHSTVNDYHNRVTNVLLSLTPMVVKWLDAQERRKTATIFGEELQFASSFWLESTHNFIHSKLEIIVIILFFPLSPLFSINTNACAQDITSTPTPPFW